MSRLGALWRSTIGRKIVMAATGLIMVVFVIGHVVGNLLVFRGPEALNHYSLFLKGTGGVLWIVRAVLLASVILHIVAAIQLTTLDHAARPTPYLHQVPQASTFASRTLRWGGAVLAVFIVFHILHLTTGTIQPVPFSATDVYSNVVQGFRIGWVAAAYVVAMIALGLHLFHGVWSAPRSLGLSPRSEHPLRRPVALAIAAAVWAGFTAIPVVIFLQGPR